MFLLSNPLTRGAALMGGGLMFLNHTPAGMDLQAVFTDQARAVSTQVEMLSLRSYLATNVAFGEVPDAHDFSAYLDIHHPNSPKNEGLSRDAWGNPYELEIDPGRLMLRSLGPDGRWGTSDDLVVGTS